MFKSESVVTNFFLGILIILSLVVFWQRPELFNTQENKLEEITVSENVLKSERIIDGDTFVLSDGRKVRLIGIDTPERGEYFFDEATARLDELISGRDLVLKKDVSETDRYGRILRHIYVNDVWVNKQMIEDGFAKLATFPPDVFHVEEFMRASFERVN